jgi:hypothetical protein
MQNIDNTNRETNALDFDDSEGFADLSRDLELSNKSVQELIQLAEERKIKLTATDKAGIIDEIIAASVEVPAEAEVGQLISLHSRDEKAKKVIAAVREVQMHNERAGVNFTLYLQTKEKVPYSQRVNQGAEVSRENLESVLHCLTPLKDGSQDALIKDIKANFENYKLYLVRVKRKSNQPRPGQRLAPGEQAMANYVMLYVEKKQKLSKKTF